MKKILMYGACALVSAALVLPAIAATPEAPTEPIKMELTKMPVVFNHSTHATVACGECHHKVDGAETYQKCSTAGCHDLLGGSKNVKEMNSYHRIAHERKTGEINSCIKCHLTVAGDDKDLKKSLTSCSGSACHPKS